MTSWVLVRAVWFEEAVQKPDDIGIHNRLSKICPELAEV